MSWGKQMMGRVVVGTGEVEMGNQSTGTESVVSIALASPFDERNMLVPSIIPQWLKLVRLNGETRIHHLKRKGPDRSKSSTGKRSAVKVACCVWTGGKAARSYLSVRNQEQEKWTEADRCLLEGGKA